MKKTTILYILLGLILVALYRVWLPIENFNPIGAMALMGGALISHKYLRYILPLGALFVGDLIMTQVSPTYASYLFSATFLTVYLAFAILVVIGYTFRNRLSFGSVIGASVLAAVAFFLVTNAGAWLQLPIYTKNLAGLIEAYVAGIPFFRATLVSQLVFSLAAYSVYYFGQKSEVKSFA